ncbi:nitroreductase family protein [Breznakiella homolactica]|uniref:Nitroreductase family protein n=1 Tax=Breznakiella homolactica TaxID=2798577 RepID=A0A7T7XR81_9SPIR|nr:nitroreductase family protein [Breznakiella homolactica]QQO10957.1 nitroreductase family protein [Breznakiella homolactica]
MAADFFDALKLRRSIYGITKKASVPDERIESILKDALLHTPSAYNSQSARLILLLGKSHDELWDAVKDTLAKIAVSPEAFARTEKKIDGFKAGYGTVLFFEDQAVIQKLQDENPLYKDVFPGWSLNSAGMIQFVVWTSLAAEGMGASLQHYNPLIDEWVQKKTGVPAAWRLLAQMPFGVANAPAGDKSFLPVEERFKVFS